ncbi:CBL-interacting serine/threonine-protein kinase 3, partial [Mucuna pruriens]
MDALSGFKVSLVSQFIQSPYEEHLEVVYRILRYLKSALGKVTWCSKKYNVVARSSVEVEYRAMAPRVCEMLWLKRILEELGTCVSLPLKLYCDSKPSISIVQNLVQHDCTKHVLNGEGYDGAAADLWSCGYLPFDDSNVLNLYKKISAAEFTCPPWLAFSAMKLITRILDPNPMTRITVPDILRDEWFKKDYKPPVFEETKETNIDDVEAIFKDYEVQNVREKKEEQPTPMNAFELISLSKGLNLENLFDIDQGFKREIRFTSKCPANEIINKIEEAAKPLGFDVQKKNFKMKLENLKAGRKGNLNVATEIFQVAPSLHVVKVHKAKGDTLEFLKSIAAGAAAIAVERSGAERSGSRARQNLRSGAVQCCGCSGRDSGEAERPL